MIIRPVKPSDLEALYRIAEESGPGFTSLMPDRDALARKIEHARTSFARNVRHPADEHYLFVLEDPQTGTLMGTTGIEAMAGQERLLYHFRHATEVRQCHHLGLRREVHTLTRCNHYRGCTEICSLYLRPAYRRAHAGKLLSRVRFLFMAQHPERFAPTVIAEMRGVSDAGGQSPFWNWLRQHFVDLEFASVTQLVGAGHTGFIDELMPAVPLYTHLMSEEARAVIGQVHPDTRPALAMLEKEGFRHRGYVDLFDAGPTVECRRSDIASVRASRACQVLIRRQPVPSGTPEPVIISNGRSSDFRAALTGEVSMDTANATVAISDSLARQLDLNSHGTAWVLPLAAVRVQQAGPSQSLSHTENGARSYAH